MFENIFSFGLKRTTKQGWGFYIGHFLILLVLGFCVGFIQGLITGGSNSFWDGFNKGLGTGTIVAFIYVSIIIFMLLKQKHMLGHFKYIAIGLLAIILSLLGGGLLGLIIPAILSTKEVVVRQTLPFSPNSTGTVILFRKF